MAKEQSRRDQAAVAAKAETEYRTRLSQMNAGQLFAFADELASSGDRAKAREVSRTLISRFPDHPLATTAAQQMANAGSTAASNSPNATAQPSGSASGQSQGAAGGPGCDARITAQEREFDAVNKRPTPDGSTPLLMRVMWMTTERIKLVRANCPSGGKYQQMINEMQAAHDQAKRTCEQLSTGLCAANAY